MVFAVDVYYKEDDYAQIAGALFEWEGFEPQETYIEQITTVNDYEPGAFYKRELPCLLAILEKIDIAKLQAIIVDGHVYIDDCNYGLGGKLYEELGRQVPVIGVAKNSFYSNRNKVKEIFRGKSNKPLYVSAIGLDLEIVSKRILDMSGEYRMPTILKSLDQLSRTNTISSPDNKVEYPSKSKKSVRM